MTSTTALTSWNIDPAHSSAEFKVRHMMISNVKGRFSGLSGELKLDEDDYTRSSVEASIPSTSIRTGDESRDEHLKGEEFLDVQQFPALTFKSAKIRSIGGHDYEVTGDLTIHGVAKSVTLTVNDVSGPSNDPWGKQRIGLSASTKINRKDFGLAWTVSLESGGFLVGDEVTITVDVELVR